MNLAQQLNLNCQDVIISNDGVLDKRALTLLGASTKRGDSNSIGYFGSGAKYAIAYLLRENIPFEVWTDGKQIPVTVKKQTLRDKEFGVIHVDGDPTSLTTDMGPQWQLWQAFRELYCNALDEGSEAPVSVGSYIPEAGKTAIVLKENPAVREIVDNFSNFFSLNTKVLWECEVGKILQKTSNDCMRIYRKGILVHEEKGDNFLYDYDLDSLEINEERLPRYNWSWKEKVIKIVYQCNTDLVHNYLKNTNHNELKLTNDSIVSTYHNHLSEKWRECIGNRTIATATQLAFADKLGKTLAGDLLIVNERLYSDLKVQFNVKTLFSSNGDTNYSVQETTEVQQRMIHKALKKLEVFNLPVNYPIMVAEFSDEKVRGMADSKTSDILISPKSFLQGIQYLVETILEEWVHLYYNVDDETRAMQDVLLQLVAQKVMEE